MPRYLLPIACVLLLSACTTQREQDTPSEHAPSPLFPSLTTPSTPSEGDPETSPPAVDPSPVFGSPRPLGLVMLLQDEDMARYTSSHSLQQLIAFYRRELSDHQVAIEQNGARFQAVSPDQADIYVVRTPDETTLVVYFRSGLESEFDAAFRQDSDRPEAGEEDLPFVRRYPWPQGFQVPAALAQEAQAVAERRELDGYYREHSEQRDGQTVRVLVVREESAPAVEEQGTAPDDTVPAGPVIGPRGSYERADGARSLRRSPARAPSGEVLPFWGTQRVELSDEANP
ncbi:MAG: hypothetical protein JW797_15520 [Bradymonadales bacterium]|nr:hypothetical protein [Bradymonadales bacterium]